MSRKERMIAGLLLAVAVAGGALIPRLLASSAIPLGIALGPGPVHSVVQAPTITEARHHAAPQAAATPSVAAVPTSAPPQPATRRARTSPARPTRPIGPKGPGRNHTPPPTQPTTTNAPPPPGLLSSKTTACDGTYSGTGSDVTVAGGATCVLEPGTTVTHDLTVAPGGTLVDSAATVKHDLVAQNPVGIVVAGGSIGHDLRIDGMSGSATPSGSYVCGTSVGHDLVIRGGLASAGTLLVGGACPGGGNRVGHDLVVAGNANAVAVTGNSVGHDLRVDGATAPPHAAPTRVPKPHPDRPQPHQPVGPGDLQGSGHGPQAPPPPHPVGPHDRGVGHLAPPAPRPAPPARHAGPKARPETRGPCGESGHGPPPPPLAHGHGHESD
jgi:hypothetical protein